MTLAQIGFIVIEIGNRGGHPQRSKWYHNFGYGNLRDYGLADKKAAIEQLARKHPWIDINRVGIYGHSGGGFMSTAAMLVYPDFFKVAVSSSGNHENNIYNRWWSEKHHGVKEVTDKDGKVKFEYTIDRNSEIAKNLKGHLLLVTGDMDNNVHPANTLPRGRRAHQGQQALRHVHHARPAPRLRRHGRLLLLAARRLLREAPARPGLGERGPHRAGARDAAGRRETARRPPRRRAGGGGGGRAGLPPSPDGLPACFGVTGGIRDFRLRQAACRPASAGQAGFGIRLFEVGGLQPPEVASIQ